ncbi:hypothetical protein QR680_000389 [Steinernema hermaphroditum]|uniref:RNA helicase n=1 Tax=Steinernema hermaphroditum TaxID=289476 RepID=A0AA39LE03_9BILA|nr:hypothetical protein QR680_000389 [Steinernema hermaphroditum]
MELKQKYFSDSSDMESERSISSDEDDYQARGRQTSAENPNMQGMMCEDEEEKPARFSVRRVEDAVMSSLAARPGPNFERLTNVSRIEITGGDGEQGFIHNISDYSFAPTIVRNFKELGCEELTAVQKATWFLMLHKREHHIMTRAQTGCGKTFAFLVPLLQRVNELKNDYRKSRQFRAKNAPLALIFAPTQQLVKQIYQYARRLACGASMKIASSTERCSLKGGCDIFVTTGGAIDLATSTTERKYPTLLLNHVAFTVIDEADRFSHDPQEDDINAALKNIQSMKPNSKLYVFSATLSDEFVGFMGNDYFHVFDKSPIPDTIDHKTFILHPREGNTAIVELLRHIRKEHQGTMPRVLIFTNRIAICNILAFFLTSFGFHAFPFTSQSPPKSRAELAQRFTSGDIRILICTDMICAGIDWDVDVVINYHLPPRNHFARFFHRIGRTGRAGKQGTIYSFFYTHHGILDQIDADEFVRYLDFFRFHVPKYLREYNAEVDYGTDEASPADSADDNDYPCVGYAPASDGENGTVAVHC